MKTTTRLINLSILILMDLGIFAQVPNGFNYQAVLRDAQGKVKANTALSVDISLLQGSNSGSEVFSETHSVTTNNFGLINLEIGSVNTTHFAGINWAEGPYFIKIVVDGTEMGTSQLLSVPYALKAQSVENEHQTLIIDGSVLTLSDGGGSVTIPTGADADNWGTQTVATDITLSGNGTTATPLKIAQNSATSGQALKWNGTSWAPANDETTGGTAGGDLSGIFPNPTIGDSKVTTAKIADNAITSLKINNSTIVAEDLANNSITTDKINTGAVSGVKISQMSATSGQALKWTGTTWAPANDLNEGINLPYRDTLKTHGAAFAIITTETGTAVTGRALSESGATEGVKGVTYSSNGYGVWGISYSPEGETYGVFGQANSTSGRAVYGNAESSTGTNYGVFGNSGSDDGYGVYGTAPIYGVYGVATRGVIYTYGVYGLSESTNGRGVFGKAISSTGPSCGVKGSSISSIGYGVYGSAPKYGVYGVADSIGITTYGVTGESASETGYGVYGNATSTTGINYGIRGRSSSNTGYGVHGIAPVTGVKGEATGSGGTGVRGEALDENGTGVYGLGTSYGVFGQTYTAGASGVYGRTNQSNGYGVFGYAPNYAIYAYSTSGSGYDFYAGGAGTNYGPFTGAHEVKLAEGFPAACKIGLIVSATGKAFVRNDVNGNVSISSTLPEVALCNKANDKAVFGVMVLENPLPKDHWFKENGRFAVVNALGEGRVWVCNSAGNIEAGDFITTSDVPGYGQKQADDILHSYTVGKATETVDWNKVTTTIEINGKTYKVYLIAVVYTCG